LERGRQAGKCRGGTEEGEKTVKGGTTGRAKGEKTLQREKREKLSLEGTKGSQQKSKGEERIQQKGVKKEKTSKL